jgi:hypothetical protein
MRKLIPLLCLALFVVVLFSSSTSASAQVPGAPAYLHAISDLRMARAYIKADTRAQFDHERHHAIHEIDAAIQEMKHAAIDDGKDLDYSPPVDARGMAAGPLHEALRLTRKAYEDCSQGVDLPNALGMRMRALGHIQDARDTLDRVIHEMGAY